MENRSNAERNVVAVNAQSVALRVATGVVDVSDGVVVKPLRPLSWARSGRPERLVAQTSLCRRAADRSAIGNPGLAGLAGLAGLGHNRVQLVWRTQEKFQAQSCRDVKTSWFEDVKVENRQGWKTPFTSPALRRLSEP
jgi:hypothetical protein